MSTISDAQGQLQLGMYVLLYVYHSYSLLVSYSTVQRQRHTCLRVSDRHSHARYSLFYALLLCLFVCPSQNTRTTMIEYNLSNKCSSIT